MILLFVVTTHRLSPHQGCDQPQLEERRQKMSLGAGRRKTEDGRQKRAECVSAWKTSDIVVFCPEQHISGFSTAAHGSRELLI